MTAPYYSRETMDARFNTLRHEFRADIHAVEGRLTARVVDLEGRMNTRFADLEGRMNTGFTDLEGRMNTGFEALRGEIRTMRGEWKIWLLVAGSLVAVVGSGIGNRLLDTVWPPGPARPPGASAPLFR